ncbi:dihydrofolate reductase family protein [Nocardiopsis sp. CT-R113]|jgi:dihydrofolate reductase|uniref:Dihydrofolate reductase family protein n=1 Tax=Nocardiopsis codii TaxID=3065942 RepID=A0ABU7K647_9ACTN|nr:dihydrofolate reductase family protein [Nocardiopsis sp. CT-R113]MEE2037659.1 dihydrofolate reductase family protein [Nocardiopsis sp. CT-R113]
MTTFHAFLGCSLDGFIAGPNDELDWLTVFDNTGYEDFFASVDALAMGRGSYDVMRAMAQDHYRGRPIHVLSTTLAAGPHPDMGRSPVTVHPDIPALQKALADAGVRRVYADGGRTVQAFLAAGLLSDLTVTRVPVLLGRGIPLFGPDPGPLRPHLVSSHATDQGAVQSVYGFSADGH